MSKALKCDRCGRYFDRQLLGEDQVICATVKKQGGHVVVSRAFFPETIEIDKDIHAELVDLCPECLHSFGDWFNGHYNQEEENT